MALIPAPSLAPMETPPVTGPSFFPETEAGDQRCRDYERIAEAIAYLDAHALDQPSLDAVAAAVGLSPYHFQRLFTRWAGLSPKRFLGCLTLNHARQVLAETGNVLDTALDVGLSGPSRLHDLFVAHEAMSPGEVKAGGAGLTIRVGTHDTPFGLCQVHLTPRGICGLVFIGGGERAPVDAAQALEELHARWPEAEIVTDPQATDPVVAVLFGGADPAALAPEKRRLLLAGTNFQVAVWRALLRIPPGALVSYDAVARAIGRPTAARAVGQAVGANPIGFLIPCHRVIRSTGAVSDYHWGPMRKRIIQAWEQTAAE